MADPDLYLIARQYERIITELNNIPVTLDMLPSLRDEVLSLREEMRLAREPTSRGSRSWSPRSPQRQRR